MAQGLVGYFEPVRQTPRPVLHDVRTFPAAVARLLADMQRLGARRPAVVLKPFAPTFDRVATSAFVEALAVSHDTIVVPDYAGHAGSDRAPTLIRALLSAGRPARAWVEGCLPEGDAVLVLGGDDMYTLASGLH